MTKLIINISLVHYAILFLLFVHSSFCQWNFSPEQTEVFDLVDETKANFYEYLNVTQVGFLL